MKKVKFTLGLALVMLFMGANYSNAAIDNTLPIENNTATRVTFTVNPSPFYANSFDSLFFYGGAPNDAVSIYWQYIGKYHSDGTYTNYSRSNFEYVPAANLGTNSYADIRRHGVTMSLNTGATRSPILYNNGTSTTTLEYCLRNGLSYEHVFEIQLNYDHGNRNIPYLERKISIGDWSLTGSGANRVNRLGASPAVPIEELLYWDSIYYKTDFTYGTNIAVYVYKSSMVPIFAKYPAYQIDYTLKIDDEIGRGDEEGSGNGNVYHNRAITINAAEGITTNPVSGMVTFVPSKKDFEFYVTGAIGKNLVVTTNDYYWSVEAGSIVVTPNGAGKWIVKILKVGAPLTVTIGYEAAPESGEGDPTGSNVFSEDKVWGSGGTLYVNAANTGTLSIYSITGQLCKKITVSGSYNATMPKGLYIVQLNGKSYKVVL